MDSVRVHQAPYDEQIQKRGRHAFYDEKRRSNSPNCHAGVAKERGEKQVKLSLFDIQQKNNKGQRRMVGLVISYSCLKVTQMATLCRHVCA